MNWQKKAWLLGFLEVVKTTSNWWDVFAVLSGTRMNALIRFRHISIVFPLGKQDWAHYRFLTKILLNKNIRYVGEGKFKFLQSNLEFDYRDISLGFFANAAGMKCYRSTSNDVVCEVDGSKFIVPFPHGTYELREVFIDRMYGEPNCQGAVIVDVGAFIGDTSIFFARGGAKLVVAFEPVPLLFEILKKNISLNGFEGIIEPRNQSVGSFSGNVDIGYDENCPGRSSESLTKLTRIFKVSQVALSEVITDLGWVDILKIDCEGNEHKILRHAAPAGALKHVGMIVMEVHFKLGNIVELLRGEGFVKIELEQTEENLWILSAQR